MQVRQKALKLVMHSIRRFPMSPSQIIPRTVRHHQLKCKTPPVKVPSPPAEESPPVELCFSSAEQGCYKRIPSEAPNSAPSTAEPLPTWL